jgi:acetate kinase
MHSGLSYSSIVKRVSTYLHKPVNRVNMVVCHLGSGASMCCIKDGQSIDTSMGLTPLEGAAQSDISGDEDLMQHRTTWWYPVRLRRSVARLPPL